MNLHHFLNNADIPKETIQIEKHEQITTQTGLYMVISGAVIEVLENQEHSKSHIKRLLGPGDIFPLYIPQTARDLNVTYQTTVAGHLVQFAEHDFTDLLKTSPEISMLYMKYIGDTLQATEQSIADKNFLSSEERIIKLLIQLAENPQFARDCHEEKNIISGLTQQHIGSLALCTRQTVTHILNNLKNEKLLKYNRNRILVHDVAKLTEYLQTLKNS